MKEVIVSNVCRADISDELKAIAKPGIVEIPEGLLAARQIRIDDASTPVEGFIKEHRGQLVTTVSRATADSLVESGKAAYLPQKLLSYTVVDYLNDPDVVADQQEYHRVEASGAELVIVAVIGDNRSPLAVVRNIVSGCQKMDKLVDDAKGALEASRFFLVE